MELLQLWGESPVAVALRQPGLLYPLLSATHIMALGILVGSITVLDLRLLGLFGDAPLQVWAMPLARVAASGLFAAISTGLLLFSVKPTEYIANPAFLVKLSLIAIGIANATLLRFRPTWRGALQSGQIATELKARAALSLAIWASVILAGRWIAFLE